MNILEYVSGPIGAPSSATARVPCRGNPRRMTAAPMLAAHAYGRSFWTCARNASASSGIHVDISRYWIVGRSTSCATLRATRPRFIAAVSAIDSTVSIVQTVRALTPPATSR